ncbi:type II toxin-antitoxin system Phd/YefM family antitoxin [Plebeiibacterium sediminum]|uniref:Antitoxin n=1 Tax=Plebeiibacterium sediminum TaxID=2992112 RepID=A0AAE3M9W6_9BACT|nr:type II toxin-antitoxin system Phd/YefM family antitoxin [Plebeiobacterium sediminum]MCW3789711.1 type II toxin-antitoxin system Phd/YefM family antitoxin [Plebeiobacterium sediminum]
MRVISSAELRNNMKKYLDLAASEQIIIQRGKKETFVLKKQEYLEPDEDLKRAISMDELLDGVKEDIREIFRKGKK